jgi:NADH:ubiquinone oxidoreductase subunit 5 (subunit L)/multisubunit Na+/H+ antiporter MnhA subunit
LSALFYYFRKINPENVANKLNTFKLYNLSFNKFYIDEIYNAVLYVPFLKLSKLVSHIDWDLYDQKFIDAWGWITLKFSHQSGKADYNWLDQYVVDGFGRIATFFSTKLKSTQSGVIQNYLIGGVIGILFILLIIHQI